MDKFGPQIRADVIKIFYKENGNARETVRQLRAKYGAAAPTAPTVRSMMARLELTGTTMSKSKKGVEIKKRSRTNANIQLVRELIEENPKTPHRKAAQALNIHESTVLRILHKDLHLKSYKTHVSQNLKPTDMTKRLAFAREIIRLIDAGQLNPHKIWFSDESHFDLEGYINKQNDRTWGRDNPRELQTKKAHPSRVTVWCAISAYGIIGPYYFNSTVRAGSYTEMLTTFFLPTVLGLEATDDHFWFQQDGARPHRTRPIFETLTEVFDSRLIALDSQKIISKGLDWPPYSPDLTPCDFFLWGHLKNNVYKQRPSTIEELKAAISLCINSIDVSTLRNVADGFTARVRKIIEVQGSHFEHLG